MRVLPLLGLGDEVVLLSRIRGQQGVRLFSAFGKFAIAENKGLSSHNVGKGRLNISIIVDRKLRGIIQNDGDRFGLYTQKDAKGRLKTDRAGFAKSFQTTLSQRTVQHYLFFFLENMVAVILEIFFTFRFDF